MICCKKDSWFRLNDLSESDRSKCLDPERILIMFQPAVPVSKILEGIHSSQYVLPAIQREFVWKPDQIEKLFDSLMRGYPIGAFLFWKVDAEQAANYAFYDFITDYHEKTSPHAKEKKIPSGYGTTAILDGQQRLTALNIGLYGSHAERQPRKWSNNPDAFPKKRLYLNLLDGPEVNEEGFAYDFKFLTESEAVRREGEPNNWFLVADVLNLANSGPAIQREVVRRNLGDAEEPFQVLYDLYRAVREVNSINVFLEESQDSNRVLDIFVRVNSGGTTLSYSDLLLSMATNQWKELDAREEVRSLVEELNQVGSGFRFSKDLVLKAGLVLTDVPDIRFQVSNFTQSNMALMEQQWTNIRTSLLTAVELLGSFGYTSRTLTADSVTIPIAFYIHKRGLDTSYVSSSSTASDRSVIQRWVTRSLMKRGIWGSGLDTLLSRLREAIRTSDNPVFPIKEIEQSMVTIGKSLKFEDAEVSELLDLEYGSRRTFPVLATVYPGLDLSKSFHEDHIFPRARFKRAALIKAGVPTDKVEEFKNKVNGLANLQLLPGGPNAEKSAALPSDWLKGPHFISDAARQQYVLDNDLLNLPESITGFLEFYEDRRMELEKRLRLVLGI